MTSIFTEVESGEERSTTEVMILENFHGVCFQVLKHWSPKCSQNKRLVDTDVTPVINVPRPSPPPPPHTHTHTHSVSAHSKN